LKAVILAAGIGSRLGRKLPKPLTRLPSGKSIIFNQIKLLKENDITEVIIVVGFKKEIIMEEYPQVLFRYNPIYHITNTSKSLLMALESIGADDVLWLNGDVYLDTMVLSRVIQAKGNIIAVNKAACGEEEVKYRTNDSGEIVEISKKVKDAEGEAVGVNKITKSDFGIFLNSLKKCDDHDYFEKGIEIAIARGAVFYPIDISDCKCVEVDFKKDLEQIKRQFNK
jgi:choline kinase